jgi:long-chain acyl-CoA synthetase
MNASISKPWVKFYEPGVPETVEIPSHTLHESLAMAAGKFPDNTAVIFFDKKMTYRELDAAATKFAAALQGLGVKKGDRVMIYMPNTPQFVIAFYGILRAGAIVVPTNPQYVPRELVYQAADSGAETLVALTMNWKTIAEARAQTALKRVILANIKEYFPPMLKFLFTVAKRRKGTRRMSADNPACTISKRYSSKRAISNRSMSSRTRSRCWVTLAARPAFPKARC